VSQCPLWVTADIAGRPRNVGLIPKSGQNADMQSLSDKISRIS